MHMRNFSLSLCLGFLLLLPSAPPALAQSQPLGIPPVITQGLDAYRKGGLDQAFRAWLRNSPTRWSPSIAAPLQEAQQEFGAFEAWELVDVRGVSPRTRVVSMVLDYQKGPVFAKFIAYKAGQQDWVLTSLKFSTDDNILSPQAGR
jgi:hypothetical protein